MFLKSDVIELSKKIFFRFWIVIVMSFIIITTVSTVPLLKSISNQEKLKVNLELLHAKIFFEQYKLFLHSISEQISSRTSAKELVAEFQNSKINAAEYTSKLVETLNATVRPDSNIIGITRIENMHQTTVEIGYSLRKYLKPIGTYDKYKDMNIYTNERDDLMLVLQNPVFDNKDKIIAYDLIAFNIKPLINSLQFESGEFISNIILGNLKDNDINLLLQENDELTYSPDNINAIKEQLKATISTKSEITSSIKVEGEGFTVTSTPLDINNWGMLALVNQGILSSEYRIYIFYLALLILSSLLIAFYCNRRFIQPLLSQLFSRDSQISKEYIKIKEKHKKIQLLASTSEINRASYKKYLDTRINEEIHKATKFNYFFSLIYIRINNYSELISELNEKEIIDLTINL